MSPAERKRLAARCRQAAHEVFAAVNRNVGAELLSLDLPMGQFKAMATITMLGPQAVGELGRRLGISEPAASLLVGKLEERGLAARVRDEQDRRRILVTATPAGEDLATRLRQGREEHVQRWLGALDRRRARRPPVRLQRPAAHRPGRAGRPPVSGVSGHGTAPASAAVADG